MEPAAFQQQDITLRAAIAGVPPAIAQIWHAGWPDGHLGNVPDALLAFRDEVSFGRRAAERIVDTSVAVVSGEVVGFTMVVADELEQIYVAASHRGLGVADEGPIEYPAEAGSEPVQVRAQRYVRTL